METEDMVLGQYVGDPQGEGDAKIGYLEDSTVPKGKQLCVEPASEYGTKSCTCFLLSVCTTD